MEVSPAVPIAIACRVVRPAGSGASQSASTAKPTNRLGIVDSDIHPAVKSMACLKPFVEKKWWDHAMTYGFRRRHGSAQGGATAHWMNRVSASLLMSGSCRMMPASSSSSAASLLNCACSPAKNFWLAARSCQRR